MSTSVSFVDLRPQLRETGEEVMEAIARGAAESAFILGAAVRECEEAFSSYLGVRHCVAVNSGTSALHLALICAGVGPGDEVLTVPMTFIATVWPITYVGARPVFVDVDPVTYTMDVEQVERRITPRTKAILPVHLYGQPADMDPLLQLGERYGIPVIEDAAQAHGATDNGRRVGSFGLAGCFSFYPSKNLGCWGEGGALVSSSDEVAARARGLRDQGQWERHRHDEIGFNYRMAGSRARCWE